MDNIERANALLAHFGSALNVKLELDGDGHLAFECNNGVLVLVSAYKDSPLLRFESGVPAAPGSLPHDGLLHLLSLNVKPDLATARVGYDPMQECVTLQDHCDLEVVDPQEFANFCANFLTRATSLRAHVDEAQARTASNDNRESRVSFGTGADDRTGISFSDTIIRA